MKISPARTAAFDILMRVEKDRAFTSVLLPQFEQWLGPEDRGLCHELTLGVLRRRMWLDRAIDGFARSKAVDIEVRTALRLGIYQLLFLKRVPDHAAINETVNLVRRAKKTSAKGFVNAVLRRATREPIRFEYADETDRIATETSHPRWLIEKWAAALGPVEAESLAAANNEIPRTAFRASGRLDEEHAGRLDGFERSQFVKGCYFADRRGDELAELAAAGEIYFQDEASQMVGAAVEVGENQRILDVCAAPGSKTTQIALAASGRPSLFAAGDLRNERIAFLRANTTAQSVGHVNVLQYDAEAALPFADESFDVVLIDAPCSGTGTIRHNPEIRYFLEPEDFAGLSSKQLRILKNASKLVRPGGRLIYSTCSIEPEENEKVCVGFLADTDSFTAARPEIPERFITADGNARTFPHRDQMDGFFISTMIRR